jgi:hypothetical protein
MTVITENEYDDISTETNSDSLITITKPKNYQKLIRNYNKWLNDKYYKNIIIECYGSGDTGTYIRDAISGDKTPYRVGSYYEYLFYRVAICTGENKMKEPLMLYYISPVEYEKHFFTKVSNDTKIEWMNKKNNIIKKYNIIINN